MFNHLMYRETRLNHVQIIVKSLVKQKIITSLSLFVIMTRIITIRRPAIPFRSFNWFTVGCSGGVIWIACQGAPVCVIRNWFGFIFSCVWGKAFCWRNGWWGWWWWWCWWWGWWWKFLTSRGANNLRYGLSQLFSVMVQLVQLFPLHRSIMQ